MYAYSSEKLWLAYGLAALCTCLIVASGLVTILLSNATYSNDFSTVFRTTREAHISVAMQTSDFSGVDPLPKHLRDAYITLGGAGTSPQGSGECVNVKQTEERFQERT